jgi:GTP diphosphokinase / guanosine-3',5'-bis(diphosphate) 3'-diphosphatase
MSTLERAIEIAAREHAGQLDKAGQPYILHPLRLILAVETIYEQMVAALHDVVEDTTVTLEQLATEGFSDEVIEAVRALTKTEGENRLVAAKRAAENSIARNVKLADVIDNMNLSRIPAPTKKDFARLEEYKQVRELLIEHGATLPIH